MARYIGLKCKLARREGTDLFLKSGVRLCHARLGSLLLKLRGVESALQLHRLCLVRGQLLAQARRLAPRP